MVLVSFPFLFLSSHSSKYALEPYQIESTLIEEEYQLPTQTYLFS